MGVIVRDRFDQRVFQRIGRVEAEVALVEAERALDRVHHVADADEARKRDVIQVRRHFAHIVGLNGAVGNDAPQARHL